MIRKLSLSTIALLTPTSATPAVADFYIELANGRYLVLPDVLVFFVGVVILLGVVAAFIESASSRSGGTDLPDEITNPEPAEYYEGQAARVRALKRKLDAETELAQSFINAKRTRAELDEIEEVLRHDQAKRRR
jgi:hypothetical protein